MDPAAQPDPGELVAHARWVEELAHRLIGDPAVADDVAQSAWVAALRTRAAPTTNVRAWWSRIVRNLASESRRREAQRDGVERAAAREERSPSGAELAARADAQRQVVEALLALDEIHRDVLLRRYFEGLSPREIARREQAPVATITSRITRAHARLRARLERSNTSWLAVLMPIASRTEPAPIPLTKWILMSTATKISVAAVVAASIAWWLVRSDEPHATTPSSQAVVAVAQEPAGAPALAAEPVVQSARAPAGVAEQATVKEAPEPAPPAKPDVAPPASLATGARIYGRVYRPDGEPAPNRSVRLLLTPGGQSKVIKTDGEGRFDERALAPGKWCLSTSPAKAELALLSEPTKSLKIDWLTMLTVELQGNAEVEVELGKPSANPIHVTGKIVGLEPGADGVLVWMPTGHAGQDRSRIGHTRDDGSYEHVLDEAGTYLVMVVSGRKSRFERRVEVPQAPAFSQDFVTPRGALRGRVRTRDGKPVAQAKVELTCRAGIPPLRAATAFSFVQSSDEQGRFAFEALEEGHYALAVHDGKVGDTMLAARCERDVRIGAEPAPDDLELVLDTGIVAHGRVNATGAGTSARLNCAHVFVFDEHGEPVNPLTAAPADKTGAFALPALTPGHYTIVGGRGDAWSQPVALDLRADEEPHDVALELAPAATLDVTSVGLDRAWIDIRDAAGNCYSALLDRNVFNGSFGRDCSATSWAYLLPSGNYEVRAIGPDGVQASAQIACIAGATHAVRLAR